MGGETGELKVNPANLMLRLYFHPKHKDAKIFENHLNSVMLVSIGKLSLSILSDENYVLWGFSQ